MKKTHWITLIVAITLALGIYVLPSIAQQQGAPPAAQRPFQVAVIDLAQVIRAHPDFTAKQTALQEKVKTAEATFQTKQDAIEQDRKRMESSNFRPGTPEHQQMFDELAKRVAQFEAEARAQQRRFALENSQIMYDTHNDIKATIERVAVASGIAQVTDYRVFESDPADPSSVAEDMDQRLVWFNPQLNITNAIIQNIYAARQMQIPAAIAEAISKGQPIR